MEGHSEMIIVKANNNTPNVFRKYSASMHCLVLVEVAASLSNALIANSQAYTDVNPRCFELQMLSC